MNRYKLPTSINIAGVECPIKSDYRDILYIFQIFNDLDLLSEEKLLVALENFYETEDFVNDVDIAIQEMYIFLNGGEEDNSSSTDTQKPLYDWEQDFNIIVAPINKVLATDIRGLDYLHWWTFLSAFMEIGECTFNTYVGIRDKLNRGKRLESYEEKIYKDNRDKIVIKKKYDATTQAFIDDILGR